MTLCIAAIAQHEEVICILSDRRLAFGFTSGEFFSKAMKVNQRWGAMLAGDDVASAIQVLQDTRDALIGLRDPSRKQVEQAIVSVVHDQLVKRIEAAVLSPYNLTVNEFVKKGLGEMGPDAFADLRQRIEGVGIGGEFLVFGFDEANRPHIFCVNERGLVGDYRRTGFWAIGSGSLSAISALAFHNYGPGLPLPTATYHVCNAKFMAERADLGRDTDVGYMEPDGTVYRTDPEVVRSIWEQDGKPRIPDDLAGRMPQFQVLKGSQPSPIEPPDQKPPKRSRKSRPPSRA